MEKNKKDVEYSSVEKPGHDRFPRIVIVIVLAEFCERFSYSGMRAFLTLYLRSKLGYSDDGATEMYHAFSSLVYVFPVLGGILADNYLGKYKTILYLMFVYASGNVLVALAAVPQLALPARLCTLLGLFLITVGTGGIKPCVTAFGGDQFLPRQQRHLGVYFSVLYFTLCIGSLVAKTVSPILRAEVHCFGDKDCYALAFGAPGLVVGVSIVIFVSAKNKYIMKKPEGNVVFDFVKCIFLGLKNSIVSRRKHEDAHWLDSAGTDYDRGFIRDVKNTLAILTLFSVLPVFWSLLDQLGSRWTLQATRMDGRFGPVTVKPDQMQVCGPIFILILIPVFHKCVYPYCERRSLLRNPLHRLTAGGALAALAFVVSGCLELYLQSTYPDLPKPGFSQLRLFNGDPCSVTVYNERNKASWVIPPLSHSRSVLPARTGHETDEVPLLVSGECVPPHILLVRLEQNAAHSYFLHQNGSDFYKDDVDKSRSGFPVVRFLVVSPPACPSRDTTTTTDTALSLYDEFRSEVSAWLVPGASPLLPVFPGPYTVRAGTHPVLRLDIGAGGVYAVLVNNQQNGTVTAAASVIASPNSVSMAWLVPQFFIISVAEVLFAVTGNEFAFRESPSSMRAVMTAAWLLTEAAGNLLIIVLTRLLAHYTQATQFFIYSGIMLISICGFHVLARGYSPRTRSATDHLRAPLDTAATPTCADTLIST